MALPNDMQRIASGLGKLESSTGQYAGAQGAKAAARNLIRETFPLYKFAADAMASTTTAYTAAPQIRMPRAGRVLGAAIQPQGTLTADATNNATVNVVKGDGAAGAAVVCASYTSDLAGGSLAAGTTKALALTGTPANARFPIGAVLSFNITKAASGVVVPIGIITVDVEWEDVDGYGV